MDKFVLYSDLVGRIWLGEVETTSESFVGVKDYDLINRNRAYKVPPELQNEDLVGYSLYELSRSRNKTYNLEKF